MFIKQVETDSLVNVETIKHEIEEDRLDNNNENEVANLYQNVVINALTGLMLIHHKWNNDQYLVMLLIMSSITGIIEIIIN